MILLLNKNRKKYLKEITAETGQDIFMGASSHVKLSFTSNKNEARNYKTIEEASSTLLEYVSNRNRNNWEII